MIRAPFWPVLWASMLLIASETDLNGAEPLDLSYVSGDIVAAAVLQPDRLLTAPELEMLPREVVVALGNEYLGVNLLDVHQAIAIVGLPGLSGGQPGTGAVLRFTKPYDKDAVLKRLPVVAEDTTYAGKRYRRARQKDGFCVHFPDERTLVLGTEPQLKKMLSANRVETPLVRLMRDADTSQPAVAAIDFATLRPLIALLMQNSPPGEQPLGQFSKLPQLLKSATATLDISKEVNLHITLGANDPKAAQEVQQLVEQAKQFGREWLQGEVDKAIGRSQDPTEMAFGQYAHRIAAKLFDGIAVDTEGELVRIQAAGGAGALYSTASTGVLIAVAMPAVQSARDAAGRALTANNLKLIGLGMHNHLSAKGRFPARAITDKDGKPLLSWRVAILPFLEGSEGEALYKEFHLDEPWDSEHNKKLIPRMPAVFASSSVAEPGKTNLLSIAGNGTFHSGGGGKEGLQAQQVTDGLSNTLMVVEADANHAVEWTRPTDLTFEAERPTVGVGHLRASGFAVLFADGSVRQVANNIDPEAFGAIVTFAGGENVRLGP